ncbi:MAG: hypothetical protein ACFFDJ_10220, partial [Candidatus Odinarchaeota archaeon]
MTEQFRTLSNLSIISLIVSIIGLCMMAVVLWGPAINSEDLIWNTQPYPLPILVFVGGGAIVYLVSSLPLKWDMIKYSLPLGIWGILTLILILSSAAVFMAFLPLVLADFTSMGWFGIIWVPNGTPTFTISTTWPIWWIWWFWAICYSTFIIEILLIV